MTYSLRLAKNIFGCSCSGDFSQKDRKVFGAKHTFLELLKSYYERFKLYFMLLNKLIISIGQF